MVTWAGGGNVNPVLALAGHLRARGHRLAAVAPSSLAPRLDAAGVEQTVASSGWLPTADDVASAVERLNPNALVVDYMLTGALCAAERAGLPTVALVHTLYRALLTDGGPYPMGMTGPVEAVNAVRRQLGLEPVSSHGQLLTAADLVLVTAPRQLDVDGETPANVSYCGALFEGPGEDAGWVPPPGEAPLVVVSMGTAGDAQQETAVLGRIMEAVAALPVRTLITLPDYLKAADLPPAPPNVTVGGYVRHPAVLPHAAVLVSHAGLGTVLAGLAHGVRLVCLPLGREQPDNAAAVERIGAGTRLPSDAGPAAIAGAISAELDRPAVTIEPRPMEAVALLEALVASRRTGLSR